jgi:hypothetical protein
MLASFYHYLGGYSVEEEIEADEKQKQLRHVLHEQIRKSNVKLKPIEVVLKSEPLQSQKKNKRRR